MPSQFFVKFEYQDKIKKVNFSEDEFQWNSICNLLSRTFALQEDSIKLSYKDPEGDVITASCTNDLNEAYKTVSPKQTIKFIVDKHDKEAVKKIKSPKRSPKKTKSLANPKVASKADLGLIKGFSDGKDLLRERKEDEPKQIEKISITSEEIEGILCRLLQTNEAKEEIKGLKARHGISEDKKNYEFSFDVQQPKLSDAIIDEFKKLLARPVVDDIFSEKGLEKSMVLPSYAQVEQKVLPEKKSGSMDDIERNLFNSSLKESIYGDGYPFNSMRESKVQDFMTKSLSQSSANVCKDLSSTHGVKLQLRFDNGKMRLMSIPTYEYSIIESLEDAQKSQPIRSPLLRRSASVNLPGKDLQKAGYQGPDPDLTRLLLID